MAVINLTPSGGNDLTQINKNLVSGNTVILTGIFQVTGLITPKSNSNLLGTGSTIINFAGTGGGIMVENVTNVEVGEFDITGTVDMNLTNDLVWTQATSSVVSNIYIHDINSSSGFGMMVWGYGIINITHSRCTSNISPGMGFVILGYGQNAANIVSNAVYYRCASINAGTTGTGEWTCGYDLAEGATGIDTLTVKDLYVIACTSNGAWLDGFHWENAYTKNGVVVIDCNSKSAGLEKLSGGYGSGYLLGFKSTDDLIFNNNTATGDNNYLCDVYAPTGTQYSEQLSLYNVVWGRTATVTRINAGGCLGLDIHNSNGTHDLVIYANNATVTNVTSYQLELSDGTYFTVPAFVDFYVVLGITGSGFTHGTTHTASLTITEFPAGISCQVQIQIGTALSSKISFTSGTNVPVSIPIIMPAAGTYSVYIDVYMEGVLIQTGTDHDQVTVV
jgi:hypothetical protein